MDEKGDIISNVSSTDGQVQPVSLVKPNGQTSKDKLIESDLNYQKLDCEIDPTQRNTYIFTSNVNYYKYEPKDNPIDNYDSRKIKKIEKYQNSKNNNLEESNRKIEKNEKISENNTTGREEHYNGLVGCLILSYFLGPLRGSALYEDRFMGFPFL